MDTVQQASQATSLEAEIAHWSAELDAAVADWNATGDLNDLNRTKVASRELVQVRQLWRDQETRAGTRSFLDIRNHEGQ